jgi:hypothetical protein
MNINRTINLAEIQNFTITSRNTNSTTQKTFQTKQFLTVFRTRGERMMQNPRFGRGSCARESVKEHQCLAH